MKFDIKKHLKKKPYKQLILWQEAHKFVLDIYRASETFPKEERYGLTSQLRRASVSIVANIVEGSVKKTDNDFYELEKQRSKTAYLLYRFIQSKKTV